MNKKLLDQDRARVVTSASAPAPVTGGKLLRVKRIVLPWLLCALLPLSLSAQNLNVSGTVLDSNSEPVVGASVVVKGSTAGVTTDINGGYTINVPANATLVFSFLGLRTKEEAVNGRGRIDVVLSQDDQSIDEVVVVGFGTQKKESVVGAIQTISPRELRVPSSSLSNAFAGKIAGVIAVQRSGEPGADGANFWIRGISTFAGNTSPLIFIDGVEVSTGDMNALAPEVIEGFSILKDATATALYGARGANGVMLITTRQGKNMEKARINIRVEGQMTMPTRIVDLADGVSYMELFNEADKTRGRDTKFDAEKIENTRLGKDPLVYPNVDWQEMLFKEASYNQTVNMNVTGGGSRVTYFMSASLNNDNGMLRNDPQNVFDNNIRQQRYSFQGNIIADLTSTTKAAVRLNTQILDYGGSRISAADIYSELFEAPGVLYPAYFPNTIGADHTLFGNKSGGPHPMFGSNLYHNPYAEMVRGYNERNENTNIVSFDLDQDLKFVTQGLKAKGMISFKNWSKTSATRTFDPTYYQIDSTFVKPDGGYGYELAPALNKGTTALATETETDGDRYMNIQFSLDYARAFGNHDVGAMLVYLQRDYHDNNPAINDIDNEYYATLPTRNQGVAGRVTYGYDRRYLAEANFGYNGSETFQDGMRFGFFPSFAVGYNISNEAFWEPLKEVVSNLKVRGSWGIVGNSAVEGRFPYLSFVNLTGTSFIFGNEYQTTRSGAKVTRYGAEGARWEEGRKLNAGIDLTLFNSLYITADFFRENREGIFMRYNTVPIESGISSDLRPYANLGKVDNEGIDISVDYNKAFQNGLIINVRGSFTYAKNTLIDRDEPQLEFEYMSDLGKPLNRNKGLIAIGLFKDEEDIKNSPTQTFSNVLPGDIKYRDMNEDGQIDGNDMTQLGDPTIPQIVYGFGASVAYKGFDFSALFQGIAKTSIMMGNIHPFNTQYSQLYQFIADDVWTEANPNPDAKYPRLIAEASNNSHNNHQASSYWLRDGSFLRLKNLEVGYTYKFARIYVSGMNLLTFSPFEYWDPELGGMDGSNGYTSTRARGLTYPTLRTYSAGLQFTF
ncbi:MAG: TonB-dependent receptor [Prevotellaceae bacterium]|jgi:TonB-linked SusC/RagA family outer membrane protein|nr:TonB-dependent receptor [Prevotellaceae bacterium]